MTIRRRIYLALGFLGALHASVLLASFFAPYDPEVQDRELPFTPPTRLHFVDVRGRFHLRPFIFACELFHFAFLCVNRRPGWRSRRRTWQIEAPSSGWAD